MHPILGTGRGELEGNMLFLAPSIIFFNRTLSLILKNRKKAIFFPTQA